MCDLSGILTRDAYLLSGGTSKRSGFCTYEADFTGYNTSRNDRNTNGIIYRSRAPFFIVVLSAIIRIVSFFL